MSLARIACLVLVVGDARIGQPSARRESRVDARGGASVSVPCFKRARLRVLLMPDLDGSIDDSDWEFIEHEATELHDQIAAFAMRCGE